MMKITGLTPQNKHGFKQAAMYSTSASGFVELIQDDLIDAEIWVADLGAQLSMFLRGFPFHLSHYSELPPHEHTYSHGHGTPTVNSGSAGSHTHNLHSRQPGSRVNMTEGTYRSEKYITGVSADHIHGSSGAAPASTTGGHSYAGVPYAAEVSVARAGRSNALPVLHSATAPIFSNIGSLGVYVYNFGSNFYENITTVVASRAGITLGGGGAFTTAGTGFIDISDYVTADRIGIKNQMRFGFRVLDATGGRLQYYVGE
jgi:hypothetical protein